MSEPARLVQFPHPSATTLVMIALALVFIFCAALAIVYFQRIEARKKRLRVEWRSVREIMSERQLGEQEINVVEALVDRHLPNAPLRVVTVRGEFDSCVEKEMARIRGKESDTVYQKTGEMLRDVRAQLGLDYVAFGQKIISSRELFSGQWVSMVHAASKSPKWSRMRVEQVDEAFFYVSAHPKPGEPIPAFRAAEEIRCRFWRDEDARYTFTTTIAAREEGPPAWQVDHTGKLGRVQARGHYRVRYDQNTTVGVLSASLDSTNEDHSKRRVVTRLRGRVTSLSAGGCALVVPQEVSHHVILRIELEVGAKTPTRVEARIVATSPISGGRTLVRAEFVGIDDEQRDSVAKYVHKRQQQIIAAREATQ